MKRDINSEITDKLNEKFEKHLVPAIGVLEDALEWLTENSDILDLGLWDKGFTSAKVKARFELALNAINEL